MLERAITFSKGPLLLITILVLAYGLRSQSVESDIAYRARGDRWEGTIQPKRSGNKIELMSAIVDYREESPEMPASLAIGFYLREKSPVSVSVRGVRVAEDYWMNEVRPKQSWAPGFGNEFRWRTSEVIQKLPAKIGSMYDLGVIVCLDPSCDTTDNLIMRVAPAVFYHSDFPRSIDGYRFTFKPIERESLTFNLYEDLNGDSKGAPILSRVFSDAPAGVPFNVRFDAPAHQGWYQLKLNGLTRYDKEAVSKTIRFYHAQVPTK
jgi:hypothetical protein